jgi:hypothetical protein
MPSGITIVNDGGARKVPQKDFCPQISQILISSWGEDNNELE